MPAAITYEEGFRYGLGGHVNQSTGEYQWSGMASTDFIADPKNNMVLLAFTQYIPFMKVLFAADYRTMVRKALLYQEP